MNSNFVDNMDSENAATRLRREFAIDAEKAVNLEKVLMKLNIVITYKEIGFGVLGACKSKGLKRLIVINPNINNIGRKRFTIAHEIGHLILHHGIQYCKVNDFNLFLTKNDIEKQANSFASELLLPKFELMRILSKSEITIDLIIAISQKYNTSLISTAIRLVSLCDEQVALFYHKDGKVIWGIHSPECIYNIERTTLNSLSIVNNLSKINTIGKGYVDVEYWFDTNNYDIKCFEETIYFSNLNSYLTIAKIEDYEYLK